MRRALLTVLLLIAALVVPAGDWPSALAQETSWPSPSKPGVVWAVNGDRSLIYALTPSGGRLKVADEPFERLILPQFSVFITRSPDGAQISYVTADDESLANARLWVVNADGSDKRLLASFGDDLWIAPLAWSPDSTQLAYTRSTSAVTLAADGAEEIEAGIALWRVDVASGRRYSVGTPPGLEADLFYGEQRTVLGWEDEGITYRRYLADDRAQVTTVDPVSGQVAAEAVIAVTPSRVIGIQADAITLPCAVIRLSQNDPRWRSENMERCDLTIGSAGCALTSAAMILRYYNVNHSPSTLNAALGDSACPILWASVAGQSNGRASFTGDGNGWLDFSWSTVQIALQAGKPPILLVTKTATDSTHFVVIVSGSGSDPSGYTINDSWDGVVKSLTAYTSNGWEVSSLRVYGGTPYCQSSACPQSGGVILFKHENTDCGGEDAGYGYVQRTTAGWQNVPSTFNDEASSIVVPSGWSVRLYQDADRGGASIGLAAGDASFDGDTFPTGLALNDQVSSFEVYESSACLAPISFAAPAAGAWISAAHAVTVTTSGGGVAQVTFSYQAPSSATWVALGSDSTAADGWSYSWNTAALAEGPGYALRAVATDGSGHQVSAEVAGLSIDHTAPGGSLAVNGGSGLSSSRNVLLTLAATDALSAVSDMQLRNSGDAWSAWETYSTSRQWQLPATAGTHTVEARFRDGAGNVSAVASATVTYPAEHSMALPLILRRG